MPDDHEQIVVRRRKLDALRERGIGGYPNDFRPDHTTSEVHARVGGFADAELAGAAPVAVAGRTIAAQKEWPITRQALLQRMRRQFQTSLLLGEAQKPEGNNVMLFGNALSRLAELEHVELVRRARERWVDRGPAFDALPELIQRFGTWAPDERLFVDCSAGTQ